MKNQKQVVQTGEIQVVKKGNTTAEKLQTLFEEILSDFSPNVKAKIPTTITGGEKWMCIAAASPEAVVSIHITSLKTQKGGAA